MAERVPLISGRAAVKAFEKAGWTFVRQKGSHAMLTKPGSKNTLSVPQHTELARGTLNVGTDRHCRYNCRRILRFALSGRP